MGDVKPQAKSAGGASTTAPGGPSLFSIESWQAYFNLNQFELAERLMICVDPRKMEIEPHITEKPEFYTPFWASACLIFTLFVFGNLSSSKEAYNYELISAGVSYIFGYLLFVPLVIYLFAKIQNSQSSYSHLINLFGYSLLPYLPASVLAVVRYSLFQYLVLFAALGLSSLLLLKNLKKIVKFENDYTAFIGTCIAIGVQFLFTVFMKLKFY